MNTQARDAEFGFNRTKGNLYSLIDEVGAKMQGPQPNFTARRGSIFRPRNGRRIGKCFHTCRVLNRAEHSIRQTS